MVHLFSGVTLLALCWRRTRRRHIHIGGKGWPSDRLLINGFIFGKLLAAAHTRTSIHAPDKRSTPATMHLCKKGTKCYSQRGVGESRLQGQTAEAPSPSALISNSLALTFTNRRPQRQAAAAASFTICSFVCFSFHLLAWAAVVFQRRLWYACAIMDIVLKGKKTKTGPLRGIKRSKTNFCDRKPLPKTS